MAPHSSVLAWRIPETGEPGGLPSMGSQDINSYLFSVPPQLGKRNEGPGVWARENTSWIWCTGPVGVGPTALLPHGL